MSEKRNNKIWLSIVLAVVAFIVFANTLNGEFVFDEKRQIVRNPLIQDSSLYFKAITSDVWAFKGDGTVAASNYWRPTFIGWLILNFQLFEFETFGWHLTNILLHVGICILAFLILRRFDLNDNLSFIIALFFAVHPIHTESVAWIVGSTDLLFSLFLLGSFWFWKNFTEKQKLIDLIFALIFYTLSLGAKELALLCLPIYFLIWQNENESSLKNSVLKISPFILIAIIYFVTRFLIIGQLSIPAEDASSFGQAILSLPSIFVFYLRQIIFPISLGVNYPLRPVEGFSVIEFLLPLIISIAIIFLFWKLAKRSFVQKLGLAILILTLLPSFNITAFPSEQIVHDRYLYFPLLGVLMLVVPFIKDLLEKFNQQNAEKILYVIAFLICILLGIKTINYNTVWKNDYDLWSHSITIDNNSAFNYSQLGSVLSEYKRYDESIKAYQKSIEIKPTPLAHLGKARNLIFQQNHQDAIQELRIVTNLPNDKVNAYTLYQVYEGLALAYFEIKDFDKAIEVLEEGRKRLPIYRAALTQQLAVVLYQKYEKSIALNELESVREQARIELLPESKSVFHKLGMLYFEFNQKDKSKQAMREYLNLTEKFQDKETLEFRRQALNVLNK